MTKYGQDEVERNKVSRSENNNLDNDKDDPWSSKYIDTNPAAKILHVSPRTLIRWRDLRKGPPFIKAGRRVLYRVSDIEAWLEKNKVEMVGEGA